MPAFNYRPGCFWQSAGRRPSRVQVPCQQSL